MKKKYKRKFDYSRFYYIDSEMHNKRNPKQNYNYRGYLARMRLTSKYGKKFR